MGRGMGEVVIELGKRPESESVDQERIAAAKAVASVLGIKLDDEKALALSDALEEHAACCSMGEEEEEGD